MNRYANYKNLEIVFDLLFEITIFQIFSILEYNIKDHRFLPDHLRKVRQEFELFFTDMLIVLEYDHKRDFKTFEVNDWKMFDKKNNFVSWFSYHYVYLLTFKLSRLMYSFAGFVHEFSSEVFVFFSNYRQLYLFIIPIPFLFLNYTLKFESTLLIFFFAIFAILLYLNVFYLVNNELQKLILLNYINFKEQIFIRRSKLLYVKTLYKTRIVLKKNVRRLIAKMLKYIIFSFNLNLYFLNFVVVLATYLNLLNLSKNDF